MSIKIKSQLINKFGTKHAKEKKKNYVNKVGQGEIIKTHTHTPRRTHTDTHNHGNRHRKHQKKSNETGRITQNISQSLKDGNRKKL